MIIIGLTGNIGTGKSTVAAMLAEMGAEVVDADRLGYEVLMPGSVAWSRLRQDFGADIAGSDGQIDRKKLADRAFRTSEALKILNEITHPHIIKKVRKRISEWESRGVKVGVIEAPLLFEAEWTLSIVNQIWVTVASEKTILERLARYRGLENEVVLARLRRQMPPDEKLKRADAVIDTDCSLDELRRRVTRYWNELVENGR